MCIPYNKCKTVSQKKILMNNFYFENYFSLFLQAFFLIIPYNMLFFLYTPNISNKLWKILKEMGISDHLTCLLRNVYAGQEATVGTGHGTTDWLKVGKGVNQGCILSPCLFNLYTVYHAKCWAG